MTKQELKLFRELKKKERETEKVISILVHDVEILEQAFINTINGDWELKDLEKFIRKNFKNSSKNQLLNRKHCKAIQAFDKFKKNSLTLALSARYY